MADEIREVRQHQAADAEKWAVQGRVVRAQDGSRSADRVEGQSAGRDAAAWAPAPYTQGAGQSGAQSFAVREAVDEPAQLEPAVSAQLLEVQMPEAHSLAQREVQEPARRAEQKEAQQLMRA
jgi:hypothetical protein